MEKDRMMQLDSVSLCQASSLLLNTPVVEDFTAIWFGLGS